VPDTTTGLSAFAVARNDDTVQAAAFPAAGVYGNAFLFPNTVTFSGGLSVSLGSKGVALVRRAAGGLHVSVNDPGRSVTSLTVTVSDSATRIDTTLVLALPQSDSASAGRTVFLQSLSSVGRSQWDAHSMKLRPVMRGTAVIIDGAVPGKYTLLDLSGRTLAAWSLSEPCARVVRAIPAGSGVVVLRAEGLNGQATVSRVLEP